MKNARVPRKIVFLLFSNTHLLDLSGAVQAFYEANQIGSLDLEIRYISGKPEIGTEQGLTLSGLQPLGAISLTQRDYLFIPGIDFATFKNGALDEEIREASGWLKKQKRAGVQLASICSGTLILAEAGLLSGTSCTSHWKCLDYLSEEYPDIRVQSDRLFVRDDNIYTSAGMTSGMDMALAIIEELYGPILASKVAREMVIYLRRDKDSTQETVYLDYQTHFNPAIHKVQNLIISHPEENFSLDKLAETANMSARNLTRTFKRVTGHTITEFKHEVKLELAKTLLNNPDLTVDQVAEQCGYSNPRQLRRIWKDKTGQNISSYLQHEN